MRKHTAVLLVLVALGGAAAWLAGSSLLRARMAVPEQAARAGATRSAPPSPAGSYAPPATTAPHALPTYRPPAAVEHDRFAPPAEARPAKEMASGMPTGSVAGAPAPGQEAPWRHREAKSGEGSWRFDSEAYDRIRDNPFLAAARNPLSTFSIDVDTAAFANVRRFLSGGQLPPRDAVRIEELVNYFRFDYPEPAGGEPFSVSSEVFACPWTPAHRLVAIGLQGRRLEQEAVPPRNLVFLLDVSGSMNEPRKLPLLKASLGLLVERLRPQDRVAIVVYAGASGLVLEPTAGDSGPRIREAIDRLEAGGSTAGGAGIQLAYEVAARSFVRGGINRVVLGTDGDFNVGITSQGDLLRLIEEKRRGGVFLSVLGFGEGNLKDSTMEKLADAGNGNYSYIDSLSEARKVLVEEAGATLVTIAKDVKVQVEWNPARAAAYRLIGYENRVLAAEDFNDDEKDAGEIGAGHSVTALYEVVPAGVAIELPAVDPLKYQRPAAAAADGGELMTLKLRYKEPDGEKSRLLSRTVKDEAAPRPSANARFAASVAAFGMLLRESEHAGGASWDLVERLATGGDADPYRAQFRELVRLARALGPRRPVTALR